MLGCTMECMYIKTATNNLTGRFLTLNWKLLQGRFTDAAAASTPTLFRLTCFERIRCFSDALGRRGPELTVALEKGTYRFKGAQTHHLKA